MIYDFITIPFSENSSAKDLWKKCFLAEKDKKPYTFKKMCKEFSISPVYDTISELEEVHKCCDIVYAYAYKFKYTKETPSILDMKKQISEKIMELLKRQKLEPRKCKYCGKVLPWNYSYGMCYECHDEMYPRRNNRNYYNDWDGDDWEDNEWDDDDDLW